MIKKEDIVEIGKFQKTHALKGELNALLDIESDFAEDGKPLIVDIDGIFVPFYAESVRPKAAESFLIKLKNIDTQEKAQELVNKSIFALRSDLVEYYDDPDLQVKADFIGFKIKDEILGEIGTIVDIDDSTDNVLFVVEDLEAKKILIPVADDFITEIDDDNQIIQTHLPEGLLSIN